MTANHKPDQSANMAQQLLESSKTRNKKTSVSFAGVMDNNLARIPINQIHSSKLNFYEQEDPDGFLAKARAIALSIERHGLIHPIEVMLEPDQTYSVISGNTRLKAVQINYYEKGIGDGMIEATVFENQENLGDEGIQNRIVHANISREKTREEYLTEIKVLEKEFEKLKAEKKVKGRRDEWISTQMGLSPRTIRNYRKEKETPKKTPSSIERKSKNPSEMTPMEIKTTQVIRAIELLQNQIKKENDDNYSMLMSILENTRMSIIWTAQKYGIIETDNNK
jgi:hypothetical protein